jgi:hypothetical protein
LVIKPTSVCVTRKPPMPPAPDVAAVVGPSTTPDGQRAAGLRFGDARVMAVRAAVVGFVHLVAGFDNAGLASRVATLLGGPSTSRQATYDLRRLRRKGLIVRVPGHHRYQLTPLGKARRIRQPAGKRLPVRAAVGFFGRATGRRA